MMSKEQVIDKLTSSANHGTTYEDMEKAYDAGVAACMMQNLLTDGDLQGIREIVQQAHHDAETRRDADGDVGDWDTMNKTSALMEKIDRELNRRER